MEFARERENGNNVRDFRYSDVGLVAFILYQNCKKTEDGQLDKEDFKRLRKELCKNMEIKPTEVDLKTGEVKKCKVHMHFIDDKDRLQELRRAHREIETPLIGKVYDNIKKDIRRDMRVMIDKFKREYKVMEV